MIDRITEQPFCQTRVSGSTFVNADCFDVFPLIKDKSIHQISKETKKFISLMTEDKSYKSLEFEKNYLNR